MDGLEWKNENNMDDKCGYPHDFGNLHSYIIVESSLI
jgi:hypothetical protein